MQLPLQLPLQLLQSADQLCPALNETGQLTAATAQADLEALAAPVPYILASRSSNTVALQQLHLNLS